MRAQDDDLTPVEAVALCTFLYSEQQRHSNDIKLIETALNQLTRKFDISENEWERIREKSKRYVEF